MDQGLYDFCSLMQICRYPDASLRSNCLSVEKITPDIRVLIESMMEFMDSQRGLSLSAPQCGVQLRLFVTNTPEYGRLAFVNPKVEILRNGTESIQEECLSLPDMKLPVLRSVSVRVAALDHNGAGVDFVCTGALSFCIQHETDHLNGLLSLDMTDSFHRRLANLGYWESTHPNIH